MGSFAVSNSGSSVQTANGPQQLLAEDKPMTKLDTTNTVSFQTISLLFNAEPPQPTPVTLATDTQLYQFAHGYDYIPTIWMEWQNASPSYPPPPGAPGSATTMFNAFGDDTAAFNIPAVGSATGLSLLAIVAYYDAFTGVGNYTSAFLYVVVDTVHVTLFVRQQALQLTSGGAVVPIHLGGTTVNIRIDVFTEPATTSTY